MKNKVKELRLEKGVTQQELATAVEVSSRTIISLEKQQYNPSLLVAYNISQFFGLAIEDVFIFEK